MSSTDILGRLHRVLHPAAKPDGVVVSCLHQSIPLLRRGGRRSLTGWSCRVLHTAAPLDGVVFAYLPSLH